MLQRFGVLALVSLLGLSTAVCGPGAEGEWIGIVTDSSGVEIVANPISGLWRGEAGWQVEEDLRIGVATGEAAYQFGEVTGIDTDSEGRIYVLDSQASEIRVFDPHGEFLHSFGRPGEGPGELSRSARSLFIGRGDTLFVPDGSLHRMNRFLPDGSDAGSFPVRHDEEVTVRWTMMPDGRLAQQVRAMVLPGQDVEPTGDILLLRDTDGTVHDTLLSLPIGESTQVGGGMPSFRIFGSEPVWAVDSDGHIVHGVTVEYNFRVREPDSGTVRMIRKPTAQKRLTRAERNQILELMRKTLVEDEGLPPEGWDLIRSNISFTDHYPVFHDVMAGPHGTLWVQHFVTVQEVEERGGTLDLEALGATEWDIFDAEGRFLGVLELPERFRPVHVRDDRIYGVWRDEMDVEYVVRLRVEELDGLGNEAELTASLIRHTVEEEGRNHGR